MGKSVTVGVARGSSVGPLPTSDALCLPDHQAEGVGRESIACLPKAAVPDFHDAIGEDMLEEAADKLHGVEGRGASACAADFTVGAGHGAVQERAATAI